MEAPGVPCDTVGVTAAEPARGVTPPAQRLRALKPASRSSTLSHGAPGRPGGGAEPSALPPPPSPGRGVWGAPAPSAEPPAAGEASARGGWGWGVSPRAAATPSFLPGAEACNRAGEAARASRPATGIGSRGGARPPSASPSRRRSLRARTAPAPARRRAETPLRRAAPRAMPRDEADPPPPPPPARAAGQRPPHLPHRSSPARPPPHPGGGGGGGRTPCRSTCLRLMLLRGRRSQGWRGPRRLCRGGRRTALRPSGSRRGAARRGPTLPAAGGGGWSGGDGGARTPWQLPLPRPGPAPPRARSGWRDGRRRRSARGQTHPPPAPSPKSNTGGSRGGRRGAGPPAAGTTVLWKRRKRRGERQLRERSRCGGQQ